MKRAVLTISIFLFCLLLKAQTSQQEYLFKEWNDYFKGVYQLPQNDYKARTIYQQLVQYSGMQFYIRYAQTFQWGQAHYGGVILLDYSALAKPKEILAFIMAHEWGHEALGHQANLYNPNGNIWQFRKAPTEDEDAADVYAGEFLASRGYDVSIVTSFLRNLPQSSAYDTHSSGSTRASNVLKGYNLVRGTNFIETCNSCNGSGQFQTTQTCVYCGGSGMVACYNCKGNGGYYANGYNIYGVWGNWWYVCNICGGTKGNYCNSCGAKGIVTISNQCNSCGGTGHK